MLRRAFLIAATAAAVVGCRDQVSPTNPLAPRRASFVQIPGAPVVNSLADDGDGTCSDAKCTLRDAIAFASSGATIAFAASLTSGGPAAIGLTAGQLTIAKNLTIAGSGADKLTVTRIGTLFTTRFRVLAVNAGFTVSVSSLSITNGEVDGPGSGVYNEGTLALSDCAIVGNRGGSGSNGAVGNAVGGTVTLTRCTVSDNISTADGAIFNLGAMTIINSTIANNTAFSVGGIITSGTLTIIQSTITGNSSSLNAAGLSGPATIKNSIIAGNFIYPDVVSNCGVGLITDLGYNMENSTTCAFTGTGSLQNTDPKLDAAGLANNGGTTLTIALQSGSPGSPAIDAIPSGTNGCGTTVTTDQRGFTRPVNGKCDIGAFEYGATSNQPPVASVGGPYTGNEGSPVTLSLSASDPNNDALTYSWDLGDGTSGTGTTPPTSHTYADNSTYTISLTVNDPGGLSSTKTTTATIANVAPTVTSLTAANDPQAVNAAISASGAFTDPGTADTHTASINWGDGSTSAGTVTETTGSGTFSGSHSFTSPGVYTVTATITDDDGASANKTFQYVVVYDPTGGFVTGGGWINSPGGAYAANTGLAGKATFGFVSRYQKGTTTPNGTTRFEFSVANLVFQGTSFQWLVVAGPQAQFKGEGTINGSGHYGFIITAVDGTAKGGGGTDAFRIKIWDLDTDTVIYDNGSNTPLGGGSINIHS